MKNAMDVVRRRVSAANVGAGRRAATIAAARRRIADRRASVDAGIERLMAERSTLDVQERELDAVEAQSTGRGASATAGVGANNRVSAAVVREGSYEVVTMRPGELVDGNAVWSSNWPEDPAAAGNGFVPDWRYEGDEAAEPGTSVHLHRSISIPGYAHLLLRVERQWLDRKLLDEAAARCAAERRPNLVLDGRFATKAIDARVCSTGGRDWCERAAMAAAAG